VIAVAFLDQQYALTMKIRVRALLLVRTLALKQLE